MADEEQPADITDDDEKSQLIEFDENNQSPHVEERELAPRRSLHVDEMNQSVVIRSLVQDTSLEKRHLPFSCTREYWEQYVSNDVKLRFYRMLTLVVVPIVALLLMYTLSDEGQGTEYYYLGEILGSCYISLFTAYFVFLVWQMRSGFMKGDAYLFKIITERDNLPEWTNMCIATKQIMYKYRPIQSISEFSAISGGQANHTIANTGAMTWVGLVMLYAAEMQYTQYSFHLCVDTWLTLVGVCGIMVIGIYELNQYDLGMKAGHYIGVVMTLCIPVGCLIRGYTLGGTHLVVPIVLNVFAWTSFLLWFFKYSGDEAALSFEAERERGMRAGKWDKKDDLKLVKAVNRFSLQCVFLEGFAIYCVTLALSWYMIEFGKV